MSIPATSSLNMENVYKQMERVVGQEGITGEPCDRACYTRDWGPLPTSQEYLPDLIVRPRTTEEVSGVLKIANRYRIPIVPWGGATSMQRGCVPVKGGIVVDTSSMNRILEIDEESRLVRVQAGVVIKDLDHELEKRGLYYGDRPASWLRTMVGGRISVNGGGAFGPRWGRAIDQVISLEVVLSTGEIIRTGPKVYEPSAGYDLTRLFLSSEGTLGVITEATLKVYPKPDYRKVDYITYPRWEGMIKNIGRMLQAGLAPEIMTCHDGTRYKHYIEKKLSAERKKMPEVPPDMGSILIGFAGKKELVEVQRKAMIEVIKEDDGELGDPEIADLWWETRQGLFNPWPRTQEKKRFATIDFAVPIGKIGQVFRTYLHLSKKYHLEMYGGGTFHNAPDMFPTLTFAMFIDQRDQSECERWLKYVEEMAHAAIDAGGTIAGISGVGSIKAPFFKDQWDGAAFEVMRNIKNLFDPHHIMNPGKKFTS